MYLEKNDPTTGKKIQSAQNLIVSLKKNLDQALFC